MFVRPLSSEFGWTRTQLSLALALSQYSLALTAPIWGGLIDRFGPRTVVVPSLSARLIADLGWRQAYAALGVLSFVFTVPAALFATRGMGRPVRVRPGVASLPVLPLIALRAFVLMCAIFILLGTISIGMLTSIVPMMVGRGVPLQAAAQLAGLTGLTAIVRRGGIGWVLDRVHPPFVVAVVALATTVAALLAAYGSGPAPGYGMVVLLAR